MENPKTLNDSVEKVSLSGNELIVGLDGRNIKIPLSAIQEFMGIKGPSGIGGVVPNEAFVPGMGSAENPAIYFAGPGTYPGFGGKVLTDEINIISWNSSTAVVKGVPIEVPPASKEIPNWSGATPAGEQRMWNGQLWRASAATLVGEEPGVSTKWVPEIDIAKIVPSDALSANMYDKSYQSLKIFSGAGAINNSASGDLTGFIKVRVGSTLEVSSVTGFHNIIWLYTSESGNTPYHKPASGETTILTEPIRFKVPSPPVYQEYVFLVTYLRATGLDGVRTYNNLIIREVKDRLQQTDAIFPLFNEKDIQRIAGGTYETIKNSFEYQSVTLEIPAAERVSGTVNGVTGELVSSSLLFRYKIELRNVKQLNFPVTATTGTNGMAFYNENDDVVEAFYFPSSRYLNTGERVTKDAPDGAAYMWYSYGTDNYLSSSIIFDHIKLRVTADYLVSKTGNSSGASVSEIIVDMPESTMNRGGVNADTGGLVENTNVLRWWIDVRGFKRINYQAFRSTTNGITFYNEKGGFISGIKNALPTLDGERVTSDVPEGATGLWFSYLSHGRANAIGAPVIDYVKAEVTPEYFDRRIDEINKLSGRISTNKFTPPEIAIAPGFGEKMGGTVEQKNASFEEVLDSFPATYVKQNIGKDQSGEYDMFGYIVTPQKYRVTIAVTAYVHGSERRSPTGLMALLSEMSQPECSDEFLCFLRDNVRWLIVFMCNPWGAERSNRNNSRGVNLNRNTDYCWVESTDSDKGTSPMSEQETINIINFFKPYRNEISYNLDCHDVGTGNSPYVPASNAQSLYKSQINEMRAYLENRNQTPTATSVPYVMSEGGFGNYFNEVFGIPSVTLESAFTYWSNRGYSPDIEVGKVSEMIAAFLCMWFNGAGKKFGGQAFYERDMCTAFKSEEYGIKTWSWSKLHQEINALPDWTQTLEFSTGGEPVYSYANDVLEPLKTVVVIGGEHNDDKNSGLLAFRIMEEISKADTLGQYTYIKRLHDNIKIIFVPSLNPNGTVIDWAVSSEIKTGLNEILNLYLPDYVLYIDGDADAVAPATIKARKDTDTFTRWTKENTPTEVKPREGIETTFTTDYTSIKIANTMPESSRYGFAVVLWLKAVLNDIASYSS